MLDILFLVLVALAILVPPVCIASFLVYRRTASLPPSPRWVGAFLLPLILFFSGVATVALFALAGVAAIVVATAWVMYRIQAGREHPRGAVTTAGSP